MNLPGGVSGAPFISSFTESNASTSLSGFSNTTATSTTSTTISNTSNIENESGPSSQNDSSHPPPCTPSTVTSTRVRMRAALQYWNLTMLRERYRALYFTPSSFSSPSSSSFVESPSPQGRTSVNFVLNESNSKGKDGEERNGVEEVHSLPISSANERLDAVVRTAQLPTCNTLRSTKEEEGRKEDQHCTSASTSFTGTTSDDSKKTKDMLFMPSIVPVIPVLAGKGSVSSSFGPSPTNAAGPTATTTMAAAVSAPSRSFDQFASMPFSDRWDLVTHTLYHLGNVSEGNKVQVFKNSGDAYLRMWDAIDNAKKEVLLQTYIFKDDKVGRRTVQKLVEAKKRNCAVEVLYDDGGNISGRSKLMEPLRNAGASVVLYRPILSHLWSYMWTFNWRISPGGLRNHRKILLVDQTIGFCGGLNVGNEYCGVKAGGNGRFRDTHCSVVGPALDHLRKVYKDTKKPEPSQFSWSRWRQRATTRLRRTYHTGSSALVNRVVVPMRKRTAYFTRPRSHSYARSSLLPLHCEGTQPSSVPSSSTTTTVLRNQLSSSYPTQNSVSSTSDPHSEACFSMQNYRSTMKLPLRAATSAVVSSSIISPSPALKLGHDKQPNRSRVFGSALRVKSDAFRSIQAQRFRHFALSIVSKHRRTTKALLRTPIADTDPVPEAGPYSQRVPATTQILQSNPHNGNFSIQYAFWQVVRKCHRRVWITTPYFLPSGKHLKAMVHAGRRGVDVRLLTGSQRTTDPWVMWYASTYITERLLRGGVRVFEYSGGGVMHAKTVVADSLWSSIGSFNWDPMSNKNLEVSLCHLDYLTAREMEKQFLDDQAVSEEVTLETLLQRPRWQRLVSWIFYHCVFLVDRLTFTGFQVPDLKYTHDPGLPPQVKISK